MGEMVAAVTEGFEHYQLFEPSRAIREFVQPFTMVFATLARAIKSGEKQTERLRSPTCEVLLTVSKLLAPLTPFFAEVCIKRLRVKESVHLESWPVADDSRFTIHDSGIIKEMAEVRKLVSLGLQSRMDAKINIRQPLSELRFKN